MSPVISIVSGATILTVLGIMFGGTFLLRVSTQNLPFNGLQKAFFRAGHAHAGVLVTLGLVCALVQGAAAVPPLGQWFSVGVLASAILIPAGFFLSVTGTDPQRPGRAMALLWAGVVVLGIGLIGAGISVIVAGATALT